ncbi:MAG: type II toxin-antitoxin system VapC family toxin [Deltaproteobacteria bacterium]|nr:type II toxin-antitoxin system VapC family toxin [Deltaproteobacteria bacterium]
MLIAQAKTLSIPILTSDQAFARYEIETLWA